MGPCWPMGHAIFHFGSASKQSCWCIVLLIWRVFTVAVAQQDVPDPYTIPSYFSSGIIETGNITRSEYKLLLFGEYIITVKRDPYIDGNYLVFVKANHRLFTTSDFQTYTLLAGSENGFADGIGSDVKFSVVWGFVFYGDDTIILPQGDTFAGTRILNRTDNSVSLLMPSRMKDAAEAGTIQTFSGNVNADFTFAQHGSITDITACGDPGIYYMTDKTEQSIRIIDMTNEVMYTFLELSGKDPNKVLWRPQLPDKLLVGFINGSLDEIDLKTDETKRVLTLATGARQFNHDGWTISDAVVGDVEHLNSWTNDTIFIFSDLFGMNVIDFKTGWVTSICRGDNSQVYSQPYEPGPVGTCAFGVRSLQYTVVDKDSVIIFETDTQFYYTMPYSVRTESIWTTEYFIQNDSADFFQGVMPQYAMIPSTLSTISAPPPATSEVKSTVTVNEGQITSTAKIQNAQVETTNQEKEATNQEKVTTNQERTTPNTTSTQTLGTLEEEAATEARVTKPAGLSPGAVFAVILTVIPFTVLVIMLLIKLVVKCKGCTKDQP